MINPACARCTAFSNCNRTVHVPLHCLQLLWGAKWLQLLWLTEIAHSASNIVTADPCPAAAWPALLCACQPPACRDPAAQWMHRQCACQPPACHGPPISSAGVMSALPQSHGTTRCDRAHRSSPVQVWLVVSHVLSSTALRRLKQVVHALPSEGRHTHCAEGLVELLQHLRPGSC